MSNQKRGVSVMVRVRPTAQFAHGAMMIDTEKAKIDLKLDASHDDVVNNQVCRCVRFVCLLSSRNQIFTLRNVTLA